MLNSGMPLTAHLIQFARPQPLIGDLVPASDHNSSIARPYKSYDFDVPETPYRIYLKRHHFPDPDLDPSPGDTDFYIGYVRRAFANGLRNVQSYIDAHRGGDVVREETGLGGPDGPHKEVYLFWEVPAGKAGRCTYSDLKRIWEKMASVVTDEHAAPEGTYAMIITYKILYKNREVGEGGIEHFSLMENTFGNGNMSAAVGVGP